MNAHEIYDDYDSSSHNVSDQSEDHNYDQSSYDDSYYPPPSQSYDQIRPHRASRKHQTALPFLSGSPQSGEDEGWGDDYSTAENGSGAAAESWQLPERPNRRRVETDTTPTRPATLGRGTRVAPPPRRPPAAPRPRPPTIRIGLNSQPVEEPRKIQPDAPFTPPTNSFADSNGHNQMPPRPQTRKPLPAFPPQQPTDQSNRGPGAFLSASDRNVAVRRPDPNPTQRQPPHQINPQPFQPRPTAIPHQSGIQRPDRATDNLNATLPRRPVRPTPPQKNIPAYNSMRERLSQSVDSNFTPFQPSPRREEGDGLDESTEHKPKASSKIALLQANLVVPTGKRPPPPRRPEEGQPQYEADASNSARASIPVASYRGGENGSTITYEKEKEKEKEPGADGWKVLELYCLDVSGSMWKSNNALKWFGKNRFTAAKELILSPTNMDPDGKGNLEFPIKERYTGLLKFDKSVQEVIKCARHDHEQQQRFLEQVSRIQPGKGTALYSAIKKCDETIEEFFRSIGETDRSDWKVVLHLLTDARDNSSDPMNAKEFADYKMNRNQLDVQHNFLYSFNNDYETSKAMADVFEVKGLIMIDNNEVDEARKKRDRMIFAALKDHPKLKAKAREYKDQSGPEGFCYSMGDIPDLVLTEKFLKKVAVVFQSESFLKEQGIFRISGSLVNVDAIVEQFLQGDTFLESLNNPHEVAHAIKNALKRSHALIPHHNRSLLLKIFADNKNEPIDVQIESIQTAVSRIGPRNYECLRILMSILSRVNEYAQFNDMNAHNLAVVFAPILMPQVFAGPPTAEEYAFLCLLIVHYHDVFQVCTKD